MQIRSRCAGRARGFVGLFRLPENFGFTNNHGVEAARDPEKMLHAFGVLVAIKRRGVLAKLLVDLACEAANNLFRRHSSWRGAVHFHAVACG